MESTAYSNRKPDGTSQTSNDISSSMMDMYNKQMNLMSGFYNGFLNFFPGMNKNPWGAMNFQNPFGGSEMFKSMFTPFNSFKMDGRLMNLFNTQFEEAYTQYMDFNSKCAAAFQKQFQTMQINGNELSEKLQGIVNEEWKATREIVNSIAETYNKQSSFSSESNRKFMEEIHNQFTLTAKRNEKFWSEALKTTQDNASDKVEKETEKENEQMQPKKQNKVQFHN